jgi:hypothetical protein
VARGYQRARNEMEQTPAFAHEVLELQLPLRLVTREEYEIAAREVARFKSAFSSEHRMTEEDVVKAFEPQGDVLRWEQQQVSCEFNCACHVLRIGSAAIATNPFELFTEYALRMKARVIPEQLFIGQLSNGVGGYLPTESALAGGSYSSKSASSFCGPEGGDALVEKTIEAVNRLFS